MAKEKRSKASHIPKEEFEIEWYSVHALTLRCSERDLNRRRCELVFAHQGPHRLKETGWKEIA